MNDGGRQVVSNGGTTIGTQINRGGDEIVFAGGKAVGTIVRSGGILLVVPGAILSSTVRSGGAVVSTGIVLDQAKAGIAVLKHAAHGMVVGKGASGCPGRPRLRQSADSAGRLKLAAAIVRSSDSIEVDETDRWGCGAPVRRRFETSDRQAEADSSFHLMRLPRFLIVSAFSIVSAMPALADGDDPVRDAAAVTLKRLDLQLTLPHAVTQTDMHSTWSPDIPEPVIWLVALVFAGLLAYAIMGMIPGWRARRDDAWATYGGDLTGAAATQEATLAEADALARQGFFTDAMHLLLLYSLIEIRRGLRLEISDSLTSREILRRARLPEDAAAALRSIVTRVERSYFGNYPAARPDYESCRAGYEQLSIILGKSKPVSALGSAR